MVTGKVTQKRIREGVDAVLESSTYGGFARRVVGIRGGRKVVDFALLSITIFIVTYCIGGVLLFLLFPWLKTVFSHLAALAGDLVGWEFVSAVGEPGHVER